MWEEDIWPRVVKKCGDLSIPLVIPRRCGRMTHKNNTPGDTPEEFFRRAVGVPSTPGWNHRSNEQEIWTGAEEESGETSYSLTRKSYQVQ